MQFDYVLKCIAVGRFAHDSGINRPDHRCSLLELNPVRRGLRCVISSCPIGYSFGVSLPLIFEVCPISKLQAWGAKIEGQILRVEAGTGIQLES